MRPSNQYVDNEEWIDDRSKPDEEFDDEQQQSFEQQLTSLRVLECLNQMTSDPNETSVKIQDVDRESVQYIRKRQGKSFLGCPQRAINHSCIQLRFNNRYAIEGDVDGYFCPGSGGRTYPH